MATLQDKLISASYPSLLHHSDQTTGLPADEVGLIEDGSGVATALSLGRADNGATITGNFNVFGNTNKIVGSTTLHGTSHTLSANPTSGVIILSAFNNRIIGTTNNILATTNNINASINNFNAITTNIGNTASSSICKITSPNFIATSTLVTSLSVGSITYPNTASGKSGQPLVANAAGDVAFTNSLGALTVTGLTVGSIDYPNTASGTSGQILVSNGNDVVFSPIGDITSSDPDIITQTKFPTSPSSSNNNTTITTPGTENWQTVSFSGGSLAGYKGVILYIEPTTTIQDEDKWLKLEASPDQTRIFPVYLAIADDAHDNQYLFGTQFMCPITESNGDFYIRQNRSSGPAGDGSFLPSSKTVDWKLRIIARLK